MFIRHRCRRTAGPRRLPVRPIGFGAILACILLGGLGCQSSTYRAEDDSTWFPTFRLMAEASPGRTRGGTGDPGLGAEVEAGYLQTFEAELGTVNGEASGSFSGTVEIGDAVFLPGTPLDGEFSLTNAAVYASSGVRTETGLEFSLLYGLEWTVADLEVKGGGQKGSLDESELGPLFGARLRWLVSERFRLYAMSRISALLYEAGQNEAGLEFRVLPRLALFTGYRRTEYRIDPSGDSEVDLRWKGIVAGVQLEF